MKKTKNGTKRKISQIFHGKRSEDCCWDQTFTCHEIGYDTIVHNEKLMPFARRLWVSISWWWGSMGCPSCVCNSSMASKQELEVQVCSIHLCLLKFITTIIVMSWTCLDSQVWWYFVCPQFLRKLNFSSCCKTAPKGEWYPNWQTWFGELFQQALTSYLSSSQTLWMNLHYSWETS